MIGGLIGETYFRYINGIFAMSVNFFNKANSFLLIEEQ